jgi:hypothetical protein
MTKASPEEKELFRKTIAELIDESDSSQCEIARALGYDNANIITLFKQGKTRVPQDKVVPLALVLGQDPGALLHHWFSAHMPGALADIKKYVTAI